jgi:hypothetical protein
LLVYYGFLTYIADSIALMRFIPIRIFNN